MIKIAAGVMALLVSGWVYADPTPNDIAAQCKPYIGNTITANEASQAKTALLACVSHLSCANPELSSIPECTIKLNNALVNAQLAGINTKSSAPVEAIAPSAPAPVQTEAINTEETVQPATTTTPITTTPTTTTDKKTQHINWF